MDDETQQQIAALTERVDALIEEQDSHIISIVEDAMDDGTLDSVSREQLREELDDLLDGARIEVSL